MIYGRNKTRLLANTREFIEEERLKMLNSKIMSLYNTPLIWDYFVVASPLAKRKVNI